MSTYALMGLVKAFLDICLVFVVIKIIVDKFKKVKVVYYKKWWFWTAFIGLLVNLLIAVRNQF